MKFVNYLKNITGVEMYPLISMVIFIIFFLAVSIYVYKTPGKAMQQHAQKPLE